MAALDAVSHQLEVLCQVCVLAAVLQVAILVAHLDDLVMIHVNMLTMAHATSLLIAILAPTVQIAVLAAPLLHAAAATLADRREMATHWRKCLKVRSSKQLLCMLH
jgi:hypothetical protein